MDSDMKWFGLIIAAIVVIPLVGMGIESYHKNRCQIELARAGMVTADIKELCK